MSLSDAMKIAHSIKKYVKDMTSPNYPTAEQSVMMVSEEVSAMIQGETPTKRPDPGSFVLDCNIQNTRFPRSLCDLGSSVNLMPYSVTVTLVLADRSIRVPEGILEDVPVKINNCFVPTDFVVLKYRQEPKDPLILRRPFLATAGAIIDVKEGRINLNIGDISMIFDMEKLIKRPLIDDQAFYVEEVSDLEKESFIDMCSDDPLENALTHVEREIFSMDNRTDDYVQLMDASIEVANIEEDDDSYIIVDRYLREAVDRQPSSLSNWSKDKAPKVELKPLPSGLKYGFLYDQSYPVIVNANLTSGELALLLNKLRKYMKAIRYSLDDIPGISPDLGMHRIHLEDDAKTSVEQQRRLNPNLKEVVKKEIIKLQDAGVIYPILDSKWVSPVHVVPKRRGITVVKNENDELIPTLLLLDIGCVSTIRN
ncbi:hypothetical protein YC2023_051307 [Brassica napus]